MTDQIYLLILLLALSAFFSGSETALVSLSRLKVRHLVDKKRAGSIALGKLKEDPQRMLSTILLGNNLVNIAASAIMTSIVIKLGYPHAVGIATGIMTFLILIFGEIVPKTLATHYNESLSLIVARPILWLSVLFYPIVKFFDYLTDWILGLWGGVRKKPKITEEELKSIIKVSEEEGAIKGIEKDMITRIFKFDDINVNEIMTTRRDMVCVSVNSKIKDVLSEMLEKQYSRMPVYKKTRDTIVGIVYVKDLLKYIKQKKLNTSVEKVMRKPYFIPETKKIDSLMRSFQKRKEHMAIVIDEHGTVSGLVTLEDVLEEIVGEIMDETEKINPEITKVKKNEWLVLGKTDIGKVNKMLNANFKEEEDFDTMSGFILNHLGRIPKEGEKIDIGSLSIIIEDIERNRISRVRVVRK